MLLCVQYHASQIERHVAAGRPWDLDRTDGGMLVLGPEEGRGAERSGFATGNADLLRRFRHEIRRSDPDVVLVLSADHIYTIDYRDVIETHLAAQADCTVLTYDLSKTEAVHHAVIHIDGDPTRPGARVTGMDLKPSRSTSSIVATEVFVYSPTALMDALGALHAEDDESEDGDTGLGDFGDKLLPHLIEHGTVVSHPHTGYWRDAGRPDSFLRAHRELTTGLVDVFDDPRRPVLGRMSQLPAARVRAGAEIVDAHLSPGSDVAGRVVRSVLGPGVVVEAGAEVVDSVLFGHVTVRSGAFVGTAIVDDHVEVGPRARLGVETGDRLPDDEAISLVGRDSRIGADVVVGPGARLDPGTTA